VGSCWLPLPPPDAKADQDGRQYCVSRSTARDTQRRVAESDLWAVSSFYLPHQAREDRGYRGTMTCRSRGYSGPSWMWPHEPRVVHDSQPSVS